jgi:hypothetical protein
MLHSCLGRPSCVRRMKAQRCIIPQDRGTIVVIHNHTWTKYGGIFHCLTHVKTSGTFIHKLCQLSCGYVYWRRAQQSIALFTPSHPIASSLPMTTQKNEIALSNTGVQICLANCADIFAAGCAYTRWILLQQIVLTLSTEVMRKCLNKSLRLPSQGERISSQYNLVLRRHELSTLYAFTMNTQSLWFASTTPFLIRVNVKHTRRRGGGASCHLHCLISMGNRQLNSEWELIQRLAYASQTTQDAQFVQLIYTARLRKYKHATEHALTRQRLVEEFGLGDNPDVLFSFANSLYANYQFADCFNIISRSVLISLEIIL